MFSIDFPLIDSFAEFNPLIAPSHVSQHHEQHLGETRFAECLQRALPAELISALDTVNHIISTCPRDSRKRVGSVVLFANEQTSVGAEQFSAELIKEMIRIYGYPTHDPLLHESGDALFHAMITICAHFEDHLPLLRANGCTRFYANVTKNGFADQFHSHHYYSYLLYVGREIGTAVCAGTPSELGFASKYAKDRQWTEEFLHNNPSDRVTAISDPKQGLWLPPRVIHKASPQFNPEVPQAQMAIVLMGFPPSL